MDKSKRIDSVDIGRSRQSSYIRIDKAIILSVLMLLGFLIGTVVIRL